MNKYSEIFLRNSFYSLICEASLRSDMAKRIMYSILPSVAEPGQAYSTGGVVDYNALKYAIEGRHDMIKFGTRACVKEMTHYGMRSKANRLTVRNMEAEARAHLSENDYHRAIYLAIESFQDLKEWEPSYGGKAWEAIARSLEKLISYDEELKRIRSSPNINPEEEIEIMKMIVIEMNVFDGLSHNTKSIMYNLIEQEFLEQRAKTSGMSNYIYDKIGEEYDEIEKLMDSKELKNSTDVFRNIKNTLTESGDINKFKEWVTKIKNSPQYYKQNSADLEEEYFRIRFRKETAKYISRINKTVDNLKSLLPITEENNINYLDTNSAISACDELQFISDSITGRNKLTSAKVLEISKSLVTQFRAIRESINKLFDSYQYSDHNNYARKNEFIQNIISLLQKASYLADSV